VKPWLLAGLSYRQWVPGPVPPNQLLFKVSKNSVWIICGIFQ
jgi:hypothetical protein